ncbi:MAG: type 1 glutamine amidotransferase [Phycisphaerales bacterium]
MPIIVFQHSPTDGLGRLAPILRDNAHALEIRHVAAGDPVPTDFAGIDALIVLGGPMNVGDNLPWMAAELDCIREANARQIPLMGICLGHQMIAKALGGEVAPADKPEIGFCPVDLTVSGQTDTIFAGVPWTTRQFQTHAQEVKKLPDGAVHLASSAACKVQSFRVGLRTYGFQFHFEALPSDVEAFLADPSCKGAMQQTGLTADEIRRQAAAHADMFERAGNRLADNIAQYMFPVLARAK